MMFFVKFKRSFTIVELSIVLCVLAIFSVMSISGGKMLLEKTKKTQNQKKIDIVNTALNNFFKNNGRLPRPADYLLEKTNVNYGKEKTSKNTYDIERNVDFYSYSPEHIEKKPAYQEVQYIEKNGDQSIDLHYQPVYDTKIYIKYMYTRCGGGVLVGNFQNDDSNDYRLFAYSGCQGLALDILNKRISADRNVSNSTIYETTFGNFYLNTSTLSENLTNSSLSTVPSISTIYYGKDLYFNDSYYRDNSRLYALKIYENNILIKDFIPVYLLEDIQEQRSIDGVKHYKDEIGLWDKVGNKFYPNITSTKFTIKGGDVNNGNSFQVPVLVENQDTKQNVKYIIYKGILPFKDIGLSEEDVVDEYGNYFEYYVPNILTLNQNDNIGNDELMIKDGYMLKNGYYGEYTKYPCFGDNTYNKTPKELCLENKNNNLYGVKFLNTEPYKKVEWIENYSSSQFIDLKEDSRGGTRIQLKYIYTSSDGGFLIGDKEGLGDSNDFRFFRGGYNQQYHFEKKLFFDAGNKRVEKEYSDLNVLDQIEFGIDDYGQIYIKNLTNNSIIVQGDGPDAVNGGRLYFGGSNDFAKIHYIKIYAWSLSNLLKDFIPVYLIADIDENHSADGQMHYKDEIGLWDKVGNKFYPNHSSIAFRKGEDLEDNEKQITYVQPPYGLRVKDAKNKHYIYENGNIAYLIVSHGKNGSTTCGIKYDKTKTVNKSHNLFSSISNELTIPEEQNCIDVETKTGIIGRDEFLNNIDKEFLFYAGESNTDFDDDVSCQTLDKLLQFK